MTADELGDPPATDPEGPFLLDAMLGKLATYLRMCGHDATYALDREVEADGEVLELARREGRTLVTRDEELAARAEGLLLLSRKVEDQLRELREAGVRISLPAEPERCGHCNARLKRVAPDASTPAYAPEPDVTDVWRCPNCDQRFWKGNHWDRVEETLREL